MVHTGRSTLTPALLTRMSEATVPFDHLSHHAQAVFRVAYIALVNAGLASGPRQSLAESHGRASVRREPSGNRGSPPREAERDRRPDPARAAGYQRHPPGQRILSTSDCAFASLAITTSTFCSSYLRWVRSAAHRFAPAGAQWPNSSRSGCLLILPVAFLGSSGRISKRRGTLNAARRSAAYALSSSASSLGAGLRRHDGKDFLAADLVWHADHRALEHAGVPVQHLLDLARIDIFAAADDHVLGSVDDVEVPVGVDIADVTGVQPTVADRLGRRLLDCADSQPSRSGP